MPIAHSEAIDFLKPGLDASFFKLFDSYAPATNEATLTDVATVITSNTYENKYAALGSTPGLTRAKGDISLDGIANKITYSIENHNYENPIEIHENDIKNDQYGQLTMRAGDLGLKARESIDRFVFETIHNGGTNLAYDQKAVFASNHVIGKSGTINNDYTVALDKTNLQAKIAVMQKFKDDQGQPARVTPDLLLVSPSLFPTAWELVYGTSVVVTKPITADSTGAVVPNANAIAAYGLTVKFSPFFTTDTEWYLLKTRGTSVKPIIVQEREPVQTEMSDVDLFKKHVYYYKGKWYGETGYYDFRNILRGNA
jgi:phage major head subunit gpT-like protein